MLSLKERAQVLRICHYLYSFNFVPVQVDIKTWELHAGTEATWKSLVCLISYGLIIVNSFYKAASLLYVLFFSHETPLHQIMVHAVLAMVSVLVSGWYYDLYIRNVHTHATFLTMTLTGSISGGKNYLRPIFVVFVFMVKKYYRVI